MTNHAQNFACTMCGKCCMNSWKISLDCEKVEEYKKLSDTDEYFAKRYKYEADSNGLPFFRNCGLLLPDMRCYLHLKYGAKSLSSICLSYPRFFLRTNLLLEIGMSYACPEAAKLLGTGITVSDISEEMYAHLLPQHPKRISLSGRYYRFEDEILKILADTDFSRQIFSRLQKCLSSAAVSYPAFEKMQCGFSNVQLNFVKYAVGRILAFPPLEELKTVENSVDSLIVANGDIFTDYFTNFFFTKSFYPYRELEEDVLLMAQFVFCLIEFYIAIKVYEGEPCGREIIFKAVNFAEENFMHINSRAVHTLDYISEWY